MSPRAILIGLPGSGKSTTGRKLAKIIGAEFADSDELVEHAVGRSVREIFATDGESTFRELEADTIARALREFDGVLALGGGALDRQQTREAIAASGVAVVRLDAALSTLVLRVGDGKSRPLLADNPAARLAELAQWRSEIYAGAATFTVDTDGHTPGHVASVIAARLHQRSKVT